MLNKKPSLAVPGRTSSAPAPRKMMDRERSSAIAHAQAIGRGKPGGVSFTVIFSIVTFDQVINLIRPRRWSIS